MYDRWAWCGRRRSDYWWLKGRRFIVITFRR
jgi:hypothetical protein